MFVRYFLVVFCSCGKVLGRNFISKIISGNVLYRTLGYKLFTETNGRIGVGEEECKKRLNVVPFPVTYGLALHY